MFFNAYLTESYTDGSEQGVIGERLVQKRHRSVYERFPLCILIGVTSGENYREAPRPFRK